MTLLIYLHLSQPICIYRLKYISYNVAMCDGFIGCWIYLWKPTILKVVNA